MAEQTNTETPDTMYLIELIYKTVLIRKRQFVRLSKVGEKIMFKFGMFTDAHYAVDIEKMRF